MFIVAPPKKLCKWSYFSSLRRTLRQRLKLCQVDRSLLAQEDLQRVAQVAQGPDPGQVDPDVRQGLSDAGIDPGQDAVGAEQPDRLGHLDEVVGGLGVHGLDAGYVDDRG